MLGLAASNRFRLTPALEAALGPGDPAAALSALRRSIVVEMVLMLALLGLVAWLGTLAPPI
jgi:putative copper resistance protein D